MPKKVQGTLKSIQGNEEAAAIPTLDQRVTALEAEVGRIKQQLRNTPSKKNIEDVWYGAFANDPIYDEVVRLGREYRESLRPKARKRRSRQKKSKSAR
jgi:hypothetical protein